MTLLDRGFTDCLLKRNVPCENEFSAAKELVFKLDVFNIAFPERRGKDISSVTKAVNINNNYLNILVHNFFLSNAQCLAGGARRGAPAAEIVTKTGSAGYLLLATGASVVSNTQGIKKKLLKHEDYASVALRVYRLARDDATPKISGGMAARNVYTQLGAGQFEVTQSFANVWVMRTTQLTRFTEFVLSTRYMTEKRAEYAQMMRKLMPMRVMSASVLYQIGRANVKRSQYKGAAIVAYMTRAYLIPLTPSKLLFRRTGKLRRESGAIRNSCVYHEFYEEIRSSESDYEFWQRRMASRTIWLKRMASRMTAALRLTTVQTALLSTTILASAYAYSEKSRSRIGLLAEIGYHALRAAATSAKFRALIGEAESQSTGNRLRRASGFISGREFEDLQIVTGSIKTDVGVGRILSRKRFTAAIPFFASSIFLRRSGIIRGLPNFADMRAARYTQHIKRFEKAFTASFDIELCTKTKAFSVVFIREFPIICTRRLNGNFLLTGMTSYFLEPAISTKGIKAETFDKSLSKQARILLHRNSYLWGEETLRILQALRLFRKPAAEFTEGYESGADFPINSYADKWAARYYVDRNTLLNEKRTIDIDEKVSRFIVLRHIELQSGLDMLGITWGKMALWVSHCINRLIVRYSVLRHMYSKDKHVGVCLYKGRIIPHGVRPKTCLVNRDADIAGTTEQQLMGSLHIHAGKLKFRLRDFSEEFERAENVSTAFRSAHGETATQFGYCFPTNLEGIPLLKLTKALSKRKKTVYKVTFFRKCSQLSASLLKASARIEKYIELRIRMLRGELHTGLHIPSCIRNDSNNPQEFFRQARRQRFFITELWRSFANDAWRKNNKLKPLFWLQIGINTVSEKHGIKLLYLPVGELAERSELNRTIEKLFKASRLWLLDFRTQILNTERHAKLFRTTFNTDTYETIYNITFKSCLQAERRLSLERHTETTEELLKTAATSGAAQTTREYTYRIVEHRKASQSLQSTQVMSGAGHETAPNAYTAPTAQTEHAIHTAVLENRLNRLDDMLSELRSDANVNSIYEAVYKRIERRLRSERRRYGL